MENDTKQPGLMFDSQLVELFRPTIDQAFLSHGDVLRSVVVVLDYYGALNDTDGINKAIWLGPEGPQSDPAGIVGSIGVTLQAAAHMFDRSFQLLHTIREEMESTLKDLHERKVELESVTKELDALKGTENGSPGGPATSAEDTAE